MKKQVYEIGDRVEKLCVVCEEVRGHVVVSVTKRGQVSRVSCPKCGTRSSFRSSTGESTQRASGKYGAPYDQTRTYRIGQNMLHPTFGMGEVTAVIEPQKTGKNSHHVVPNPNGGWSVKKGDASRASKLFDKKEDAVAWGESISKREGTEFVIHGSDGTIERRVS